MKSLIYLIFLPFLLEGCEVLSFGDAITDHIVFVDWDYIEGERGGSFHVDLDTFEQLIGPEPIRSAGGSASNTMKGLAHLGHQTAIIGRIGEDLEGKAYLDSLLESGVVPLFTPFPSPTPRVVCMIEPNGCRTMRGYFGDLDHFPSIPLDPETFRGIQIFHIEGYQIHNLPLLHEMIHLAKEQGALISMDMGCFQLVQNYRERLLTLIEDHLDIVFANHLEAKELTGLEAKEACEALSTLCPTVVVTTGLDGGYIAAKEGAFHYSAIQAHQIDDTGAGDLFIAGFLHGLLKGAPLEQCAKHGAILSSKIVQTVGTQLPLIEETHVWNDHQIGIDFVPEDVANCIEGSTCR